MKVFITHLDRNLIVNMIKMGMKKNPAKQQHRHKTAKGLLLFKRLKPRAKRFDA